MGHLNLCFPEWQGYAESNSVHFGTLALRNELAAVRAFEVVDVPPNEILTTLHDIKGYEANLRQLRQTANLIREHEPQTIFMLGGTCAAEIAPVSWLNQQYTNDITVIWFDAHGDLNTASTSASKHFHGMPLRSLCGEGDEAVLRESFSSLSPDQVVLVGTRDLDAEEVTFIEKHQLSVVPPAELDSLLSVANRKSSNRIYLHIDLDVLDPHSFSNQLLPVDHGVTTEELLYAVSVLKGCFEIVGSSIVEYAPKNNSGQIFLQDLAKTLLE